MVCAAMTACRISPRWYGVYEHLARKIGRRAAKVALGRRLLTVVNFILKRKQPYKEDYEQRRAAEQGAWRNCWLSKTDPVNEVPGINRMVLCAWSWKRSTWKEGFRLSTVRCIGSRSQLIVCARNKWIWWQGVRPIRVCLTRYDCVEFS